MFGACSVLLRMNKSAQVGGAQTHHDKIGGRNDVDDILFAYGVVTRRLPSSCIHTEHGVYYRGIDTIQTTSSVQTAASRSSERQKPIYYNTTRGRRILCTIASWLTGLKDRIWMIAFAWIGLVPFPACSDIRAIQEGGESGWTGEVTRGVGGRKKWKKKKARKRKRKYSPEFQKEVETFMVRQNVGSLRKQAFAVSLFRGIKPLSTRNYGLTAE